MSDLVKMPPFANVNDVVEWQAARIEALEAALKWHCDHYASTDLNHQDYRVRSYTIAVEALGLKNIGDMFCDDIATSLLEVKP